MSINIARATAQQYGLSPEATQQLLSFATPALNATRMREGFWRVIAVTAAALGGFGVIMWTAANWEDFGRMGRFALLQTTIAVFCLGAAWLSYRQRSADSGAPAPIAATAMGLVALLGIGALFAYFGQTYQTGADAWQLFAIWAVLALPICFGLRSDVVWVPWALVAMTGITLWLQAHSQWRWHASYENLTAHLIAWSLALAVIAALHPWARRLTGAGVWSFRLALSLCAISVTSAGLLGLFSSAVAPQYALALLLMALGVVALCQRLMFDVYGLSVFALSLIVLTVCGTGRGMTAGRSDLISVLFVLGLLTAALLAGAVKLILALSRRYAEDSEERAE